jgi:hypothetical protein
MPRVCLVCQSDQTREIDAALVDGVSISEISRTFSIPYHSVDRHKKNHLAKSMVKAKEAEQVADADTILARVEELLARAWRLADAAEHAKQLDTALRGIGQVRSCLELLARLSGELKTQATTVNVAVALRNYSDAQVTQMLLDAGHAGWTRIDPAKRAANELQIFTLLAKGLRGSTQDEIRKVLQDAGNCEAFLANPVTVMNPSQSSGKPN